MKAPYMRCTSCHATFELGEMYRCPSDGGQLQVLYDYDAIREEGRFGRAEGGRPKTIERFFSLLPLTDRRSVISLGEGGTPLVRARRLAERVGVRELYLKLETCNPTGSFKDRQISVAISRANEWKRTRFGTVSSGNVGIALSAYCAASGFQANVWVADDTPAAKRRQIQVYGANVFLFPNPEENGVEYYRRFFNGLLEFACANGIVPMISARPVNPYMVEGSKTISFEIASDLGGAPDRVYSPVGGGGLMGGLWKGFSELLAVGEIDRLPVMSGIQRSGHITPIDELAAREPGGETGDTFDPLDGVWAWESIQESHGTHMMVSDAEVEAAQIALAREEGVFAEPQGAISIAGLLKAARNGEVGGDTIVCLVTGHGLKDAESSERFLTRRDIYRDVIHVESLEESVMHMGG